MPCDPGDYELHRNRAWSLPGYNSVDNTAPCSSAQLAVLQDIRGKLVIIQKTLLMQNNLLRAFRCVRRSRKRSHR